MSDHSNLLLRSDLLDHRVKGVDFDVSRSHRIVIHLAAISDPSPQNAVIGITLRHQDTTLMRSHTHGFSEHQ